jgi:hypothetical protein
MMGKSLVKILLAAACTTAAMANVVILPGAVAKPFAATRAPAANAADFFHQSIENEFFNNSAQVLMSSFDQLPKPLSAADGIRPSGESFVRGAIRAWGEHLHLVIRPEEVWFAILVQMNFYMNSHAEELRSLFVSHEGQQVMYIEDITWYSVLIQFKDEIQARVKTPWLHDWIMPNFTTTTESDLMTANILMMGLTKAYFKFEGGIICGLPSVTLLGDKADWQSLLNKLDRLSEFGSEPTAYKARLKPILSRFVSSFDNPDSEEIRTFWNQIVNARSTAICGAPPYYMSGWITGFLFWDDKGNKLRPDRVGDLVIDGQQFPELDIYRLPIGYARAPFIMRDFNNTARYEAYVLAGTLGEKITAGAPPGYAAAVKRAGIVSAATKGSTEKDGTLQPMSSWVLYGPVDHNKTNQDWRSEMELYDLVSSVRSSFVPGKCGKQD